MSVLHNNIFSAKTKLTKIRWNLSESELNRKTVQNVGACENLNIAFDIMK